MQEDTSKILNNFNDTESEEKIYHVNALAFTDTELAKA